MKNLLVVTFIAALSLTATVISPKASATNIAQTMCDYVAADDKQRLRSFLKTNKLKIRSVFDGIQCNGMNLVAFAAQQNATSTGELMISKLPKKTVADLLASITSSELASFAEKRVNS
ncbi:DUF3718 domain-containing protein [Thalassotalea profundi]|uniref:DUF3718 domain-containing protein n=1 Tax=Thalassotalea profundi TaxID=2036687 RepID=A0ABQ3J127_9GAMM|nr:DUF3718 domain-containing protein [Thalassotalea profundi]GHE98110.1 hypothetical protein GCM10011501_29540 [Thalassotalea profundi]